MKLVVHTFIHKITMIYVVILQIMTSTFSTVSFDILISIVSLVLMTTFDSVTCKHFSLLKISFEKTLCIYLESEQIHTRSFTCSLQSFTKYLRQALVSIKNSMLQVLIRLTICEVTCIHLFIINNQASFYFW